MAKIYQKTLNKFSFRKIPAQKSMGTDNYRFVVRDLEGKFSKSEGAPEYILSNPVASGISPEKFAELEKRLETLKEEGMAISLTFIKRFGKKFVENII